VLRELQPLRVYAAPSILRILREENSMFGMLNRVEPQVIWTPMNSGAPFPLLTPKATSRTALRGQYLSGRYPKYVKSQNLAGPEAMAALFFEASGKRVAYVPAVGISVLRCLKNPRCRPASFRRYFWSDDELIRVQGSGETAHRWDIFRSKKACDC